MTERKQIPGFKRYEITPNGDLFVAGKSEKLPWHKSNGYRFARLINDAGVHRSLGQHKAMALAFIPIPVSEEKLTVNHKDGKKDNNVLSNLEWVSYSRNIKHAYETGLRTDKIPVIVKHLPEGDPIRFSSMGDCAIFLGISREYLTILRRGRRMFQFREFLLEFLIDESTWSNVSDYPNGVAGRNIYTGKVTMASTIGELGKLLGVEPKLIRRVITSRRIGFPVKGFDFRAVDAELSWPSYTTEELGAFKGMDFIHQPIIVEFPDGKETLVGSVVAAQTLTGTDQRSVRYAVQNRKPCVRGFRYRKYIRS